MFPAPASFPLLLALIGLPVQSSDAPVSPESSQGQPPARALALELTQSARLAGTSGSLRAARMVERVLRDAGFAVEVDQREVVLSLPRRLDLGFFTDSLAEIPFHERLERFDPDAKPPGDVPPFNAWTASGEVRGPVVDAGYGRRVDFERLISARVNLEGAIALCRYGKGYRGVKVDLATHFGCAGVLLFSDPADDGGAQDSAWPKGPWKPVWAVQRGSISPMGRTPGDPSTPGFASPAPGAKAVNGTRLSGEDLDAVLPTIPCLPIPASEAAVLLERLSVRRLPDVEGVKRATPVGPGPVEALLSIDAPRDVRVIRNVLGRLAGAGSQTVIAGNHRDAWVRGAHDAGSGTVALLRAAQHLGERRRGGWKPAHTILLAFWDAEESGLIGSTEWGEANVDWLAENAIAYVNADAAVSGTSFHASGTPGLEAALARALALVPAPSGSTGSVFDQWLADGPPRLDLPGSGSDFTVFLHHLTVPTLDFMFTGNEGGQYHTSYDDFQMMERFLDPGFVGHELAGNFVAALMAELADWGTAAFDDAWAAQEMERHASEAASWLGEERARSLASAFRSLQRVISEVRGSWLPDLGISAAPDYGPFGTWPSVLDAASTGTGRAVLALLTGTSGTPRFYAALRKEAGLPERAWFKNQLWAPELEQGYGSETFPVLRIAAKEGEAVLDAELAALVERIAGLRASWEARSKSAKAK